MGYRRFLSALFFIIAFLQVILGISKHLNTPLVDFSVYHLYSRLLLTGHNPYELVSVSNIPFNYTPSAFFLFVPVSFLPLIPAQILYTLISISIFTITALCFLKVHKLPAHITLVLLGLLFQNFPFKFNIILGQSNLIVLSFIFLSYIALVKKKDFTAGIFWGLACVIKLTPLVLIIFFIFTGRFRTLVSGIFLFILTNLIVLAIYPTTFDFFSRRFLPLALLPAGNTTLYDQSIRAFLFRLGIAHPEAFQLIISALLVVLVFLFTRFNPPKFFSLLLLVALVSTSYTWQHHLVFTFPAFIFASLNIWRTKKLSYLLLTLISAVLVGMHFPDITRPPSGNPFIISHALLGSILLFILLLIPQTGTPQADSL